MHDSKLISSREIGRRTRGRISSDGRGSLVWRRVWPRDAGVYECLRAGRLRARVVLQVEPKDLTDTVTRLKKYCLITMVIMIVMLLFCCLK